jgi:hypothetical protein
LILFADDYFDHTSHPPSILNSSRCSFWTRRLFTAGSSSDSTRRNSAGNEQALSNTVITSTFSRFASSKSTGSHLSRSQPVGQDAGDSSSTSTSAQKPSCFRDQVLALAHQAVVDKTGKITAELQKFGQLACQFVVGSRMREKCGGQAKSITPYAGTRSVTAWQKSPWQRMG